MAEYASLTISVDATQVVKADAALDKMTHSAGQAEKQAGVLDKAFGNMKANVLALAGTLSVGMFASWIAGAAEAADATSEAAEAAGLATVEYSRLRLAMQLGAADGADIGASMRTLNDAISKNHTALQGLGIATVDASGYMRSAYDVTLDVAAAFGKMDDETQKAALAQDLFGRSGAQMLPLLNKGREGVIALGSAAVVASASLEKSADEYEKNMDGLLGNFAMLRNEIAEGVLPRLNDILEWAVKFGPSLEPVLSAVGTVAGALGGVLVFALKSVMTSLSVVMAAFQVLGHFIASAGAAIALAASGDFKGAYQAIGNGAYDMVGDVKTASAQLVALWGEDEKAAKEHGSKMRESLGGGTVAPTGTMDASTGKVTTDKSSEVSKHLGEQLALEAEYNAQRLEARAATDDAALESAWAHIQEGIRYEQEAADAKEAIEAERQKKIKEGLSAAGRLLEQASAKSRALAKAALIFNKGMALAKIAQDTPVAAAGAAAAVANIPVVGPALAVAASKAMYLLGGAAAAAVLSGGGGGGGGGGGSSPVLTGGGGTSSLAPSTVAAQQPAAGGTLTVHVVGIGDDTLVTGSTVKKIMDAIGERLSDGAKMGPVNMVFSA